MPLITQPFCDTCGKWFGDQTLISHLEANPTHIGSEKTRYVNEKDIGKPIEDPSVRPPPPSENTTVSINAKEIAKQNEIQIKVDENTNLTYSWKSILSFRYGGAYFIGEPNCIKLIAYPSKNGACYAIRIVDKTNNSQIVAARTVMGDYKDYNVITLAPLYNIPEEEAIFEYQVRRTSGASFKLRTSTISLIFGDYSSIAEIKESNISDNEIGWF